MGCESCRHIVEPHILPDIMILNLGSLAFNANIETGGGTPAWGTELGQGEGYKFAFEDMSDFFTGMVYKSVADIDKVTCPLGKGGNQRADYDFVIASLFDKVFVNGKKVDNARFLLLVVKKLNGDHHVGRRTIKYNPRMTYRGEYVNDNCFSYLRDWEGGEVASTYRFDITADDRLNVTDISISDARAPEKKTFSYERLKISYGGDLVTINVKTNPSTGFDWYYKKTDDSSVKIMKPSYKSTSTDPTAAGAPSKGSYPLQILKEGQTSFYFSYMRNWKGGEIADTYRIDVTASAGPVIDRVEIVRVDELKDIPDLHE